MLNEPLTTSTIIEDVYTFIPNITPQASTTAIKQPVNDVLPENKKVRIAKYLNDTILPSRTPLSESDPFQKIISKDYLVYFAFGSSIALFVVNLFL